MRQDGSMLMTWANLLTIARLLAIFPCAWAIHTGRWSLAAVLFVAAVITDFLDGPIARRYHHASALGGLLDHATDALFVGSCLAVLSTSAIVNPWLPGLVLAAFCQYMFDSKALSGQTLRTNWLGRNNGIAYYVLVGVPVIRNALELTWPNDTLIKAFGWLLLVTTAVSMIERGVVYLRMRE